MKRAMPRLLLIALAFAFACAPARAQNSWPTAGGGGVSGYVAMCLDGNGNAVPATTSGTCAASAINFVQQVTGTTAPVSGHIYQSGDVNSIYITSDNVDATAGGASGLNALFVQDDVTGSNASGGRNAITTTVNVKGLKAGQAGGVLNFLGIQTLSQAQVNMGGTDLTAANVRGSLFGAGINAVAAPGATNLSNVTGAEVDVKVQTGASTRKKSGISIATLGASDLVQGGSYDTALSISRQSGGVGWLHGIMFSDYNGAQPMDATGTVIGTQGSATTANGIDFSSYTFTGAPIIMPLMTPATSAAACTTGSIKWDASFIYICTSTNTWKRATLAAF